MDIEEGKGLVQEQRILLKDIGRWAGFMVSPHVISEIREEKVEKDREMLMWRERKASQLTETSGMLRRGKWR